MDIIKRNFFSLLSSGAFGLECKVEPMSPFKWRRLGQMVVAQHVVPYFTDGLQRNSNDHMLNTPLSFLESEEKIQQHDFTKATLSSVWLNHRLRRIMDNERHSIDTSLETMQLLGIIAYNVDQILNRGLQLDGIIILGRYLRERGEKVDYVKLDRWISKLHLLRMAQLQGSLLCVAFDFEDDEIPFMKRREPAARKLLNRALSHTERDTALEWHFRQGCTGFVINNSSVMRRNLRRSIRYYNYAPLETVANFVHNFIRSLSEIEE